MLYALRPITEVKNCGDDLPGLVVFVHRWKESKEDELKAAKLAVGSINPRPYGNWQACFVRYLCSNSPDWHLLLDNDGRWLLAWHKSLVYSSPTLFIQVIVTAFRQQQILDPLHYVETSNDERCTVVGVPQECDRAIPN